MRKIAALVFSIVLISIPSFGFAHTTLISSDPKPDSTIQTWPTHLTLTFGEPLQVLSGAQINKVSVTNANAQSLEGETTVKGATLTVPVRANDADGPVLVNYRIAAADGHVLDGEFSFNYKKGAAVSTTKVEQPHHGNSKNFPLIATSTVLILFGLLFGIFAYRRKE
jgi:methionine-rich copper-binding protein CopC